jgi:hypothetical protein
MTTKSTGSANSCRLRRKTSRIRRFSRLRRAARLSTFFVTVIPKRLSTGAGSDGEEAETPAGARFFRETMSKKFCERNFRPLACMRKNSCRCVSRRVRHSLSSPPITGPLAWISHSPPATRAESTESTSDFRPSRRGASAQHRPA